MSIMKGRLQLECHRYTLFMKQFNQGKFKGQRLGQAFYDHFNLHKLANQDQLCGLYEADGKYALEIIGKVFMFN